MIAKGARGAAAPHLFLLILLLLSGCATPSDAPAEGWSFHARAGAASDEALAPLATNASFDALVQLATTDPAARQIGGRYQGALEAGAPLALRFEASAPMRVEFRLVSAEAASATGGTCDWPADSTDEKVVGTARVRMRSTETTCELDLTPTAPVAGDEPTFVWEARTREPQPAGWSLRFEAAR